jgi:hypothetical protein
MMLFMILIGFAYLFECLIIAICALLCASSIKHHRIVGV